MHAPEAGSPAQSLEAGATRLSVKPSECFQASCARSPAARRKGLHHCRALSRAQALLRSIFPFQPRSVFNVGLSVSKQLVKRRTEGRCGA